MKKYLRQMVVLLTIMVLCIGIPIRSPAEAGSVETVQPAVEADAQWTDEAVTTPDTASSDENIDTDTGAPMPEENASVTSTGAAGPTPEVTSDEGASEEIANDGAVDPAGASEQPTDGDLLNILHGKDGSPAPQISEIHIPSSRTLGVKEQYLLPVGFSPANAEDPLTYSSRNSKIASVDPATGLITAKKVGMADIIVRSAGGAHANCRIMVKKAPSSISLQKKSLTLGVGETYGMHYTLSSGSASKVTLESKQPDIATIDETGRIEAKSPGVATIVATTFNKKTLTCTATVLNAPEGISLDAAQATLGVGQVKTLTTTLSAGSAGAYGYSSSNPAVATVDSSGSAAAKGMGMAMITVQTYNGKTAQCQVMVKPAPSKVSLGKSSVALGVGERYALEVVIGAPGEDCFTSCTYVPGDKKIATVSADGTILAKKTGSTTVTVKTHNGKKATCKVTVVKAPSSLSLNEEGVYLGLGETFQLKAKLPSGSSGKVTYRSTDESIATVDENGLITARGKTANMDYGAEIIASTYNEKPAGCLVAVRSGPTSIQVGNTSPGMQILEGKTEAIFVYANGTSHVLSYTLSDPSVLEIREVVKTLGDCYCVVYAKKPGTSTVTVSAYNGVRGSIEVIVLAGPTGISINLPSKLEYGYQYNLDYFVRLSPAGVSRQHIKSIKINSRKYAVWNTLRDDGQYWLAPIQKGSVTITVETWNGKKATKTVKTVDSKNPHVTTTAGQIEPCYYFPA